MAERASKKPLGARATSSARPRAAAPSGFAALQRSAGNRAVASLLAPDAPRAVQRDPDDDGWSFSSLAKDATSAYDSVAKTASADADYLNTPFRNQAKSIGAATDAFAGGVDAIENFEHDVVHSAADSVKGVPVLGSVAEGTATSIDLATQVTGGFAEGAVDLVGGMAKAVVDPYDAVKGMSSLVKKLPPAVMADAGANAIGDLVAGKGLDAAEKDITGGASKAFNNVWGGIGEGTDPKTGKAPQDAGIVRGLLNPFYNDVAKGKPGHAVGRAGADAAAILFGGELAEAGEAAAGTETAAGAETAVGEEAAAADATAAEETAPATLKDPPVGNLKDLSGPAQKAYNEALANGKSPSAAYQEASSLDADAAGQKLGQPPEEPRIRVDAEPEASYSDPETQNMYEWARRERNMSVQQAKEFAEGLEDDAAAEGDVSEAGRHMDPRVARRGAGKKW